MTEPALREPEQIRQGCTAKFRPEMSDGMFYAILGYLLGEDWAEPRIEDIIVFDGHGLARTVGEETHSLFLGARECRSANSFASARRWTWMGTRWDRAVVRNR